MDPLILDRVAELVDQYGWTIMAVFPADDDPPETKSFTYTVGMAVHGGYEYMIAGLSAESGYGILAAVWEELETGWRPIDGAIETGFANLPCRFQLMTDEHEANAARMFWMGGEADFRVIQIVWGDKAGVLPGEPGFNGEEFLIRQQILGSTL